MLRHVREKAAVTPYDMSHAQGTRPSPREGLSGFIVRDHGDVRRAHGKVVHPQHHEKARGSAEPRASSLHQPISHTCSTRRVALPAARLVNFKGDSWGRCHDGLGPGNVAGEAQAVSESRAPCPGWRSCRVGFRRETCRAGRTPAAACRPPAPSRSASRTPGPRRPRRWGRRTPSCPRHCSLQPAEEDPSEERDAWDLTEKTG